MEADHATQNTGDDTREKLVDNRGYKSAVSAKPNKILGLEVQDSNAQLGERFDLLNYFPNPGVCFSRIEYKSLLVDRNTSKMGMISTVCV